MTTPSQGRSARELDEEYSGLNVETQERAQRSVALVRQWLSDASAVKPARSATMLADVLADPNGLAFTVGFVDGVVRPEDPKVAARALNEIAPLVPRFLPWYMRSAVRLGGVLAPVMPGVVVPIARRVLRKMVSHLIIDASPNKLGSSISRLRKPGVSLNINLLGEAVLGRAEAARRLAGTEELLRRDDVDYVSIKVSSTVAPHNPWASDEVVSEVVDHLLPLFRIAAQSETAKFVNLDMEEYHDLDLTLQVFTQILDRPEFLDLSAGIVLQAYLPDALGAMIRLQEWSADRRARGGADIKVRVVKGANLPMETVEARVHGWPLATWGSKLETDVNYKRVLEYAMTPERVENVRIGIAGHNLFDIAHSWLLANDRGASQGIEYEMLLGMAEGETEAVQQTVGSVRLYTPVVSPKHFDVAIAYLIRRLEEGASSANFMSAVFELSSDEALFARERARFLNSLRLLDTAVPQPHRGTDRHIVVPVATAQSFENCPDTDPAVALNRTWAAEISAKARESALGKDELSRVKLNDKSELDELMSAAQEGGRLWGIRPAVERAQILRAAGQALADNRDKLLEVAMSETGKTIDQGDPEVSEAIDFAYYYADQAEILDQVDGAVFSPVSLTVVTPPWNFPLAIPAGSTLAALAAGSGVILKPAPQSARSGAVLAEVLWSAGVPRDALTLINIDDEVLGKDLISDLRVDRVILTGAYETAELFRSFRTDLPLLAETSGKNAIIVTPSADFDLAVKDIVASAFGHAGQKCSAASLVVLVGSVARSERFEGQLVDAVNAIELGSEYELTTQMSRVVEGPGDKLLRGLTTLGQGESWLVEPRQVGEDTRLWSPGLRGGVRRGSEFHKTEYFGPILGVMTAENLDEALEIVNEVDYGLTSGIHSLDAQEINSWVNGVQAGNLYVNRGTTGAIVERQPFGGWKKSSVGPGSKAGGPNYLFGLGTWSSTGATSLAEVADVAVESLLDAATGVLDQGDNAFLQRSAASDATAWSEVFSQATDVSGLVVERNIFRYCTLDQPVVVRLGEQGSLVELVRVVSGALAVNAKVAISSAQVIPDAIAAALESAGLRVAVEDKDAWTERLRDSSLKRVRSIGESASDVVTAAGGRPDLAVWGGDVTESGRIELLPFLREQALSITAHRFGSPNSLINSIEIASKAESPLDQL